MPLLVLRADELQAALPMREVIDAIERAFLSIARGGITVPDRLHLEIPERDAMLLEMPAYLRPASLDRADTPSSGGALGTKIVSVFPSNREKGLDTVQAIYVLLDPDTGSPLAMMEGRFITSIRTAATSAVATKHLASRGPKQLAVFGAGVQAEFHIAAMMEVAEVALVLISSRTTQRAERLAQQTRERFSVEAVVVPPDTAAKESDLICTCSSSPAPLFEGGTLKPGTHINAVGAFTPSTRELDSETIRRSRVIIDSESAAGREAGELQIPLSLGEIGQGHASATLAQVVSGEVRGRRAQEEITVFKSTGLAAEDLLTAQLAYAKARQLGLGLEVKF